MADVDATPAPIAPYYRDIRIVSSTISSVAFVAYCVQLYFDRRSMMRLIPGKGDGRPFATKSAIRLGGAFYTLVFLVGSADQIGAYRIYGTGLFAFKNFTLTFVIGSLLGFAFYKAMIAAFPFILGKGVDMKTRLGIFWTLFVGSAIVALFLREIIEIIEVQIFIDVLCIALFTVFFAVVIVTYVALKRHQKFLEQNNGSSDRNTREFRRLLKQVRHWRYFSLIVAVAYIGVNISLFIKLADDIGILTDGRQPQLNPFFEVDDPSKPPVGVPFDRVTIETAIGLILFMACLWYSWIWESTDGIVDTSSSGSSKGTDVKSLNKSLNKKSLSSDDQSELASLPVSCRATETTLSEPEGSV